VCIRGEPRNFICLATVSRGICQILPRKTVGPTHNITTRASSQMLLPVISDYIDRLKCWRTVLSSGEST